MTTSDQDVIATTLMKPGERFAYIKKWWHLEAVIHDHKMHIENLIEVDTHFKFLIDRVEKLETALKHLNAELPA